MIIASVGVGVGWYVMPDYVFELYWRTNTLRIDIDQFIFLKQTAFFMNDASGAMDDLVCRFGRGYGKEQIVTNILSIVT